MAKRYGVSFANITGGKKRISTGKKRSKKVAKYHLKEMTISKKKFRQMDEYDGKKSMKKARMRYRQDHANELADMLLNSRLKNPERYEEKLQQYIDDGKLFNPDKNKEMKRVAKKAPALFAYTHIVSQIDPEQVRAIMKSRVNRLSDVVDEKTALKVAPLSTKSEASKVLRMMIKVAAEKDSSNFDAREFFSVIRPKSVSKKEWREIIVSTVFSIRGHANGPMKEIVSYAINILGEMEKDRIKRLLRKYADNISNVSDSGEKLNFLVSIKDLSDVKRIEKVLDNNPKIANVIGQL